MMNPKKVLVLLFSCSMISLVFIGHVNGTTLQNYPENHCLSFDGVDDYLSCGSSDIFKIAKLTIEFWMKPKYTIEPGSDIKYGSYDGVILRFGAYGRASDDGYWLEVNYRDGYLYVWSGAGGVYIHRTSRDFWSNSSWYHVIYTVDPVSENTYAFYINGTIDNTGDSYGSFAYKDGSSLVVGGHHGAGYKRMFGGLIDEVRLWSVKRSHSQASDCWNRILTPTESASSELIGYWRFDEGFGTTSEDHSSQNNDAMFAASPYGPSWVDYGAPIIPEFPSFLILPLFMIATLLAVIIYRRKHQTRNKKREV